MPRSHACSLAVKWAECVPLVCHTSIEGNGHANLETYVFRVGGRTQQ